MKIAYIDPMSYSNLSIYDKCLLNNIKGTEKLFFCNEKIEFEDFENTELKKIYKYSDKKGIMKFLSYLLSQIKLFFYILFNQIEVLHVQWIKSPLIDYLLYSLLKKIKIKKLIFTAHNILPHNSGLKYKEIYKEIYKIVDIIIVHSETTKKELILEFLIDKDKIVVIPHGIFNMEIKTEDISKQLLKKKENEIIFTFIGQLGDYKGINYLIDAWENSNKLKENKKIRLVIAGKGKCDFKNLEEMKNVTIINRFLSDSEFKTIMNETDLFLLPYKKISQSGVLASILSLNKPVVVSNKGGLSDPFKFGNIGWIIDEINSETLRKNLEKISDNLMDIDLIKRDTKTWSEINNYYSWLKIGEMTKKIYEKERI